MIHALAYNGKKWIQVLPLAEFAMGSAVADLIILSPVYEAFGHTLHMLVVIGISVVFFSPLA